MVLGAGPVGILGAMALLVNGFKTYVYSRSAQPNPKADLVNSIGDDAQHSDGGASNGVLELVEPIEDASGDDSDWLRKAARRQ